MVPLNFFNAFIPNESKFFFREIGLISVIDKHKVCIRFSIQCQFLSAWNHQYKGNTILPFFLLSCITTSFTSQRSIFPMILFRQREEKKAWEIPVESSFDRLFQTFKIVYFSGIIERFCMNVSSYCNGICRHEKIAFSNHFS